MCRETQQLRAIHQGFLWRHELRAAVIVADRVCAGFERSERRGIGLLLRHIPAARCEGSLHVNARIFSCFLDRRTAAEDDQVRKRKLFAFIAVCLCAVELLLYPFERTKRGVAPVASASPPRERSD